MKKKPTATLTITIPKGPPVSVPNRRLPPHLHAELPADVAARRALRQFLDDRRRGTLPDLPEYQHLERAFGRILAGDPPAVALGLAGEVGNPGRTVGDVLGDPVVVFILRRLARDHARGRVTRAVTAAAGNFRIGVHAIEKRWAPAAQWMKYLDELGPLGELKLEAVALGTLGRPLAEQPASFMRQMIASHKRRAKSPPNN